MDVAVEIDHAGAIEGHGVALSRTPLAEVEAPRGGDAEGAVVDLVEVLEGDAVAGRDREHVGIEPAIDLDHGPNARARMLLEQPEALGRELTLDFGRHLLNVDYRVTDLRARSVVARRDGAFDDPRGARRGDEQPRQGARDGKPRPHPISLSFGSRSNANTPHAPGRVWAEGYRQEERGL